MKMVLITCIVISRLLITAMAAPSLVMVKGPLSFTDHFAASLMSPSSSSGSGNSGSQSVPRPPSLPNPPQAPRPPSKPSSSSSSGSEELSKNETLEYSESVSGENPCPKDMIQSANLNAIEVIERDACCPNSIGVFAGPAGCCALEHKSCTHTARCCDSSLECNTVAGATMLTCERPSVFTGSDTTPSSAEPTTPVSDSGSNVSESVGESESVSG